MATTQVETVNTGADKAKLAAAVALVIASVAGFYLLGKIKFAHDSDPKFVTVPKLLLSIITFSFVIYLIPGMFGAPLKAISGYLPPQSTHDFDLHQIIREAVNLVTSGSDFQQKEDNKTLCEKPKYSELLHLPHGLEGYVDYEQHVQCILRRGASAAGAGRPADARRVRAALARGRRGLCDHAHRDARAACRGRVADARRRYGRAARRRRAAIATCARGTR